MKSILIDTNILLRLILKDNLEQLDQVYDLFEKVEAGKAKLYCKYISLFEVAFVLLGKVYKLEKPKLVLILEKILELKVIEFEEAEVFNSCLNLFLKENISLPDAFLIASSKQNNQEFFTFDKRAGRVRV